MTNILVDTSNINFLPCRKCSSSATDQCYIIYGAVAAAAAAAAASLAPGTFVSPNVPNLREILHPRHLSCSINLSQHATRGRTEQTELIRQNRSKTTLENIHVIIRRGGLRIIPQRSRVASTREYKLYQNRNPKIFKLDLIFNIII